MKWLGAGLVALLLVGCASALRWEGGAAEGSYEVRSGDTLYSIATRHDLDFRALAQWNNIPSPYRIYPGQTLRLTPSGGTSRDSSVARAPTSTGGSPPASSPRQQGPATRLPPAPPPASSGAPVRWQWPLQGDIVRSFAPPDSKGIVLSAQLGTPVRAAGAGRVVYSGNALKGYGELIIIKHDETFLSVYGHNQRRLAQEGQEVKAGAVIGEVGLGPQRRPMLHFEIRRAGQPTDPLRLLPGAE